MVVDSTYMRTSIMLDRGTREPLLWKRWLLGKMGTSIHQAIFLWSTDFVLNDTCDSFKTSYRSLHTPASSMKGRGDEEPETVELVTVPRFGAEWTKDELRNMTKRGRSEEKTENRKQAWREWNQDRRGLFGIDRLRRKTLVWTLFIMVIVYVSLLETSLYQLIPN